MSDTLTRSGATRLAMKIANYWHSRGYRHFEAQVVPIGAIGQGDNLLFGVRSNIGWNGFPPTEAERKAA